MAAEILKSDDNHYRVAGAQSDSTGEVRNLRVDEITN